MEDWLEHGQWDPNSTNPFLTRCSINPYCLGKPSLNSAELHWCGGKKSIFSIRPKNNMSSNNGHNLPTYAAAPPEIPANQPAFIIVNNNPSCPNPAASVVPSIFAPQPQVAAPVAASFANPAAATMPPRLYHPHPSWTSTRLLLPLPLPPQQFGDVSVVIFVLCPSIYVGNVISVGVEKGHHQEEQDYQQ